jgi:hypothetical protein
VGQWEDGEQGRDALAAIPAAVGKQRDRRPAVPCVWCAGAGEVWVMSVVAIVAPFTAGAT